jgi:phytoene dehydrogenase-like protein
MQKKVIIIGGGLAGLSAACLAVQRGLRVDLYEQNPRPGGNSRSTSIQGFEFDHNPKIFPAPYLLDALIKSSSESNPVSRQFQSIIPATKLFFADGMRMQYLSELSLKEGNLETQDILTLKGERAFQKIEAVLQDVLSSSSGKKKPIWQRFLGERPIDLHKPLMPYLQQLSTDPYFQQSMLTLSAMTGIPISTLQIRDLFLPALMRKSGLFSPKQGWEVVVNTLLAYLAHAGVKILTNRKVTEILNPQKNVLGIRLDDQSQHWADAILNTTSSMAPAHLQYRDTQAMMIYHLGLKQTPGLNALTYHNVLILNGNHKKWNSQKPLSSTWLPDYLYLYQPTQDNPSLTPSGRSLLSIKIPLPDTGITYREKEMIRLNILAALEQSFLPDLKETIEMEHSAFMGQESQADKLNSRKMSSAYPIWRTTSNKLVHLHQYYDNRRPSTPAILFAVQRWIENLIL